MQFYNHPLNGGWEMQSLGGSHVPSLNWRWVILLQKGRKREQTGERLADPRAAGWLRWGAG